MCRMHDISRVATLTGKNLYGYTKAKRVVVAKVGQLTEKEELNFKNTWKNEFKAEMKARNENHG